MCLVVSNKLTNYVSVRSESLQLTKIGDNCKVVAVLGMWLNSYII